MKRGMTKKIEEDSRKKKESSWTASFMKFNLVLNNKDQQISRVAGVQSYSH